MGQYCFVRWRLSSVVVCNAAGGRADRPPGAWKVGRRRAGRVGGRQCMAGQYGHVPLGRHLVQHVWLLRCRRNARMRTNFCGFLRHIVVCCGENDATCRTAPQRNRCELTFSVFLILLKLNALLYETWWNNVYIACSSRDYYSSARSCHIDIVLQMGAAAAAAAATASLLHTSWVTYMFFRRHC